MEHIYLIGGSGFIGKNLVEHFVSDYELTVVDKYIDEAFFSNLPQVNILKMDLVEDKIPTEYPSPDYIINLASIVTAERDFSLFDRKGPDTGNVMRKRENLFGERKAAKAPPIFK